MTGTINDTSMSQVWKRKEKSANKNPWLFSKYVWI